jgi:hypothetical protein
MSLMATVNWFFTPTRRKDNCELKSGAIEPDGPSETHDARPTERLVRETEQPRPNLGSNIHSMVAIQAREARRLIRIRTQKHSRLQQQN